MAIEEIGEYWNNLCVDLDKNLKHAYTLEYTLCLDFIRAASIFSKSIGVSIEALLHQDVWEEFHNETMWTSEHEIFLFANKNKKIIEKIIRSARSNDFF